nr:MAG TPA: hypothetical protein [Caudoviricetes sp.]
MKQVGRNSDFVRIRLDIPKDTYRNLMELYKLAKAQGVTENPDVIAASCIDSVHELIFKKGGGK